MRLVIFDLDGTLIESEALIVGRSADLRSPTRRAGARPTRRSARSRALRWRMRWRSWRPADRGARRGDRRQLSAALPPIRRDRARAAVRGRAWRRSTGCRRDPETILAVATGKGYRGAVTLLERHGIVGRFNSIETPTHNRGKPDPQMIETAMASAGADRTETVMIGDTVHDMRMAKAAGVEAIGVAWGYHEVDELRAGGRRCGHRAASTSSMARSTSCWACPCVSSSTTPTSIATTATAGRRRM